MAITWPAALRLTSYALPVLENADRSGGVALSGGEQIVESPAGRWVQQVTTIINDRTTLLAWQALVAQLGGRSGEILMPVTACLTQPGTLLRTSFVEGDGAITYFDDGTGFVEEGIRARLGAAAALNATVLTVETAATLEVGQYLGLDDRLHHIRDVLRTGDGLWQVTVRPWTRAAAPAGTDVRMRTAVCRMRLRDPKQLQQPVDLGRFARPTLDFVEAF